MAHEHASRHTDTHRDADTVANTDTYNLEQKKERFFEQAFLKLPIINNKKIGDEMKAFEKSFNLRPIPFLWLNSFSRSVKLSV